MKGCTPNLQNLLSLQTLQTLQCVEGFELVGQKQNPEGTVSNALVGTCFDFGKGVPGCRF